MSNRILSYRGLMPADSFDTILLSTKKGEVGYRITKLEVVSGGPVGLSPEAVIQIWKDPQSATSYNIDFSNNRLLAAAFYENNQNVAGDGGSVIIFDQEIFNQDIYLTCASTDGAINYYLEIEVIKLDESQAMVATLKDIRNNS